MCGSMELILEQLEGKGSFSVLFVPFAFYTRCKCKSDMIQYGGGKDGYTSITLVLSCIFKLINMIFT